MKAAMGPPAGGGLSPSDDPTTCRESPPLVEAAAEPDAWSEIGVVYVTPLNVKVTVSLWSTETPSCGAPPPPDSVEASATPERKVCVGAPFRLPLNSTTD